MIETSVIAALHLLCGVALLLLRDPGQKLHLSCGTLKGEPLQFGPGLLGGAPSRPIRSVAPAAAVTGS